MNAKILPYFDFIEEELASGHRWGCFITPNDKPIVADFGTHGSEAYIICRGSLLDNFNPKITKSEIDMLEQYMEYYKYEFRDLKAYEDFLVNVLGYDRLATQGKYRYIGTSNNQPYTKFYNYYLCNWDIDWQLKTIYVLKDNTFNNFSKPFIYREEYERKHNLSLYNREMEMKEEADLVKVKIPLNERYKFFK